MSLDEGTPESTPWHRPGALPGPSLRRGLAVIAHDGGTIIQGGARRQVFRGKAARGLLPRLLPLLNGTRSLSELCEASGLAAGQLDKVMAVLEARGVLEEPAPHGAGTADAHVRDYASRTVEWNGSYREAGEYLDALSQSRVCVFGDPAAADEMAADLMESGVGHVESPGLGTLIGGGTPATGTAGRRLLVALDGSGPDDLLARVVAYGDQHGIPVLRLAVDGDHVEIGPVFLTGYTACVACCRAGRAAAGWGTPQAPRHAHRDLLVGLACSEVLAFVGRSSLQASARALRRVSTEGWTEERYFVAPEPGCPDCSSGPPGNGRHDAELYEWIVERPPPVSVRPGEPAQDVADRWAGLADDRPRASFVTRPRCTLPAAGLPVPGVFGAAGAATDPVPRFDPEVMADVLARVGGFRDIEDATAGRWAPSGGSLASVELYLVTEGEQFELPGNVFRYDDTSHELIALRPEPVPLRQALRSTGLPLGDAVAGLIMVAAHRRLAAKYGVFAYRLAQLDAGCATTQLAAVLNSRGVTVDFASDWGRTSPKPSISYPASST